MSAGMIDAAHPADRHRGASLLSARALWTAVRGRRVAYTLAVACNVLAHLGSAVAIGAGAMTVVSVLRGEPERVLPFGALALLAAALRALASWGESWLAHDIAFGLLAKVRLSLYDAFGRQGPAVLGRTRTGALTTAAMSDAEALEEYYAHSSVYQFGAFLATPLLLGALAVVSPRAALACVPVMLAGFLLTVAARGLARRYGGEVRQATSELGGLATELGGAVREVVAFGHRDLVAARLDAGQARLDRALRANALVTSLDALVIGVTGAGCAVVAAVAVSDGSAAVATPLVLALAGVCAAPLAQWAAGTRRHGMTVGADARIRSVLEAPGPVAAYGTRTDPRDEGSVRAEALSFGWASVPDGPFADDAVGPEESLARAVDEASLTIAPDEHVALAGPSGAGKSTLAALITRAVDAEGGTVVVAGHAVAEYAEADLASVASLLPQYPAPARRRIPRHGEVDPHARPHPSRHAPRARSRRGPPPPLRVRRSGRHHLLAPAQQRHAHHLDERRPPPARGRRPPRPRHHDGGVPTAAHRLRRGPGDGRALPPPLRRRGRARRPPALGLLPPRRRQHHRRARAPTARHSRAGLG